MKKGFRGIISSILVICILLAVSGCSMNGGQKKEKEKTIVGTWECEVDMTKYFHESFVESAGEDVGKFFEFHDLALCMVLDIRQDGSIAGTYEEKAIDKFNAILLEDMKVGMQKYMESTLEGTGVTLEDALKQADTTIEKMVEESFQPEALKKEMLEEFLNASYRVKDDKMYIVLDKEDVESSYLVYEFKKDVLTIKKVVGMEDTDFANMTLPLKFKRK